MITQEQARMLHVGDKVHHCLGPGTKCEEWRVCVPYARYEEVWLVELRRESVLSGISETRMDEWHLPGQCTLPSRLLRVRVERVWDGLNVGFFYIDIDANEEFLQKNTPVMLRAAQILAGEGLK